MNFKLPAQAAHTHALPNVWCIDTSLFSLPFTYHLCEALATAGCQVRLYTRPLRILESPPPEEVQWDTGFYFTAELLLKSPISALRRFAWLLKGASHAWGLARLVRRVGREKPSVVHFVWLTLPLLDQMAIRCIRRTCPVVVMAHNADPLHGKRLPLNGLASYIACYRLADVVATFTPQVRDALLGWGINRERITLIAHPPFRPIRNPARHVVQARATDRCVVLMFGVIRRYKGVETLLEAALQVMETTRNLDVRVIGRCEVDLSALKEEISSRGLGARVLLDTVYVSEERLAREIEEADILAFPYLETDASAALSTGLGSGKAIVLSDVGLFADLPVALGAREDVFVPPGDASRLGALLARLAADRGAYQRNAAAMHQLWRESAVWADVADVLTKAYEQAASRRAMARDYGQT